MRTVVAFSRVEDAQVVRSLLEGSGIPASVRDEYTVAANLLGADAIGGVKVEVADEDYGRACEVLQLAAAPVHPDASPEEQTPRAPSFRIPLLLLALVLTVVWVVFGLRRG